jgi:hypothetical protein
LTGSSNLQIEAGLPPDTPFSAHISLVVHDDPKEAMRISGGIVPLFARFSAMYGTVVGPASDGQRKALKDIHSEYDIQQHGPRYRHTRVGCHR